MSVEGTHVSSAAGGLFVYEDLRGTGAPVVLVHSLNAAASSYEMEPLFDGLLGNKPVLAFDLPGFGRSERGERTYDRRLFRQAILAMLERATQHRGIAADLVALSLGCELAAEAALERPDLVRTLTFLSPTGLGFMARRQLDVLSRKPERVLEILSHPVIGAPLFALLASGPSIRYFLSKSFVGPVDQGLAHYDWTSAHQPGARFAPLAFVSGTLFDPEVRSRVYEKLDVPVHVLYDEDAYTDFGHLPEMVTRRGWKGTRIAPTRGLPQFEQRERTLDAMRAFWTPLDVDESRMDRARDLQPGF